MQKNNQALREYANHLESLLGRCRREHGGNMDTSYLRLRPKDDSDAMWVTEDVADYIPEQISVDSDTENDPTVKELCRPTRNLSVRFSLPSEG